MGVFRGLRSWLPLVGLAWVLSVSGGELCVRSGERIVFLGDSITQFGDRPDGYVRLVMDGLRRCGVEAGCIPAGVSGEKSDRMLQRLPGLLERRPDWLLLSCGVNDVGHGPQGIKLPDYQRNIRGILDGCAAAGVKVMVLTPTLCRENLAHQFNLTEEAYCEFLRQEAALRKLPLADLNRRMREELESRSHVQGLKLTVDSLHMNGYGNQMMACGILAAMGVPEKRLREFRLAWNRIPSMAPLLNAWYNPQYKISIDDYETLAREAGRRQVTVDQLLKDEIQDYIRRLRR